MRGARESSTCCPPIPKGFTCQFTIQGSCSVVLPPELLPSALPCWLAQPGILAGAGTIAGGIKSGSLRQCGVPRLPLGGRRIARGAGHRDPGGRIARAIGLNALAVSRSVLADPAVAPKFRMFGRSVLADPAVVPKLRMFGRNALVADQKTRTFGRSAPAGLARVPKSQAFDLSGLRLVPRLQVVQRVLVVHNGPAMRLAPAADIVTSLVRVRISRRDSSPAIRPARAADIVTRLVRVRINRRGNRSRRRDLGPPRPREPEGSPPRDKETRASAIALRAEDDLGRSESRCETLASGDGCSHREVAHARLH